jgi:hypothetical protein
MQPTISENTENTEHRRQWSASTPVGLGAPGFVPISGPGCFRLQEVCRARVICASRLRGGQGNDIRPVSRRVVLSTLAALPALHTLSWIVSAQAQAADPLSSWNDGRTKQACGLSIWPSASACRNRQNHLLGQLEKLGYLQRRREQPNGHTAVYLTEAWMAGCRIQCCHHAPARS